MITHPDQEKVGNFDVLWRRTRLRGHLITRSALRIGAGGSNDSGIDLPVLRDTQGHPYLPGASIKGVMRSTLESILRSLGRADLWSCDPLDEKRRCGHDHRGNRKEAQREENLAKHCTICRLFGNTLVAGRLRISDAPVNERTEPPAIEMRDGVGIDRDLGAAKSGLKYDYQVVPPGTGFELEVFADNATDWMLGLLALAFEQLHEGFVGLGGFTTRGLGRVTIEWTSLHDFEPKHLLTGTIFPANRPIDDDIVRWRTALAAKAGGA